MEVCMGGRDLSDLRRL